MKLFIKLLFLLLAAPVLALDEKATYEHRITFSKFAPAIQKLVTLDSNRFQRSVINTMYKRRIKITRLTDNEITGDLAEDINLIFTLTNNEILISMKYIEEDYGHRVASWAIAFEREIISSLILLSGK